MTDNRTEHYRIRIGDGSFVHYNHRDYWDTEKEALAIAMDMFTTETTAKHGKDSNTYTVERVTTIVEQLIQLK